MEAVATLLTIIFFALIVFVPIAIAKPELKLFRRFLGDGATRKKATKVGLFALVVTFFGIGFTAPSNSVLNSADTKTPTTTVPTEIENIKEVDSKRKPKVTTKDMTEKEVIAFTTKEQPDSSVNKGQTRTVQAGKNGERTIKYKVTYTDGKETKREEVSNTITTEAVEQIVAVGTYVAPAATAPQQSSGCNSNYSGGCVPIASDVDCGGGSGDGPAYFYGTATVVGSDVYGLDRDKDGVACN